MLILILTNIIAFAMGCVATHGIIMEKQRGECPRNALGYNCKGSTCDHSFKAQMQIRKDFNRE